MASARTFSGSNNRTDDADFIPEVGKDQGDGLRVFALNEFRELLRVRFLKRVQARPTRRLGLKDLVSHPLRAFIAEGPNQKMVRIVGAAPRNIVRC